MWTLCVEEIDYTVIDQVMVVIIDRWLSLIIAADGGQFEE